MTAEPPPSPPRTPPVLAPPVALPPVPGPPAPPSRPPASVLRRALVGLGVSAALAFFGVVPLVGLPGLVPVAVADFAISTVKGTSPLAALRDSSWAAALFVTILGPIPIAPTLALVTWRRPRLPGAVAWLLAFGVAGAWALGVAFALLLAS